MEEPGKDLESAIEKDMHYWESGWSCWLVFLEEFGNVEVSRDKPALQRWVEQQRLDYIAYQRGLPSDLDDEKVARMNEKGFGWVTPAVLPPAPRKEEEEQEDDEDSKKPAARTEDDDKDNNTNNNNNENHEEVDIPEIERMTTTHEEEDPLLGTYHSNFAGLEDPLGSESEHNADDDKMDSDEEWTDSGNNQKRTRQTRAAAKSPAKAKKTPTAAEATPETQPPEPEEIKSESRYPRRTRRTLSESEEPLAKRQKLDSSPQSSKKGSTPTRKDIHTYQIMKVSERTGKKELRQYETRNMRRLVPVEQEEMEREKCRVEYAELLQCDESLVPDKKRGVDHQTAKSNVAWEEHFLDFLLFKKIYGHGIVPKVFPQNAGLGRWTVRNRRWWKSKDKRLTRSRLRRLNAVAFVWEAKKDPTFWSIQQKTTQEEDRWESKFNMLLEYKTEFGDCLVPKEYKPNMVLARWVSEQRKQRKAKSEGKNSTLTDEREQRLLDVGFVFNSRTKEMLRDSVLKRFQDRWDDAFQKLLRFKQTYGHAAVPRRWKEDKDLASWAMRQRSHGKRYMRGEDSYLTKERFELLKSVDFVFEMERSKYPMERGSKPKPPPGEAAAAAAPETTVNGDQVVEGVDADAMEVVVEEAVAAAVAAGADNKMGLEQLTGTELANTQTLESGDNNAAAPIAPTEAAVQPYTSHAVVADTAGATGATIVHELTSESVMKSEQNSKPKPEETVEDKPSTRSTRSTKNKESEEAQPQSARQTQQRKRAPAEDLAGEAPKRVTRSSKRLAQEEDGAKDAGMESSEKQAHHSQHEDVEVDEGNMPPTNKDGDLETKKKTSGEKMQGGGGGEADATEESVNETTPVAEAEPAAKEPTPEELQMRAQEELLKKNKGRWTCEFCGKDEHLNYVKFVAHEAACVGLEELAIPSDVPLE